MLEAREGLVESVVALGPGILEARVACEGERVGALCYVALTGPVEPGDRVIVNTTAVSLGLGTGGYHFVIWVVGRSRLDMRPGPGHIMKMRYTPLQVRCLAVEEDSSPYRASLEGFGSLEATPVVCCELHSMVAPVTAGIREAAGERLRIAYVMTDWGALPLAYSRLVPQLRARGLLDSVTTCGHAFGGDLEAVSLHSALAAARACARADVIVVAMGPGQAGTGTTYGFSGIGQGEAANAAYSLGGTPIVVPRVSFRDERPRHLGVSHHTITVLARVALAPCLVVLPEMEHERWRYLRRQLSQEGIDRRHVVLTEDGRPALDRLGREAISVTTMGRGPEDDPAFFLAAGAAGILAGRLARALDRAERRVRTRSRAARPGCDAAETARRAPP